jgi:hypothetical protein
VERLRLVTSGTYHLEVATANEAGSPVTPTAPLTVAINDGAGVAVLTPTTAATMTNGISYDADQAVLSVMDTYACIWTGKVGAAAKEWGSIVEVCGGYLFEIAEMRDFDPAFADPANYSDAKIRAARTGAEQRLERACRVSFVPRARRLVLTGSGRTSVHLPDNAVRAVVSLAVDGEVFTADQLAELDVREWGRVIRGDGLVFDDGARVEILYQHGYDYPDFPVVQAAMLLAREYLVHSGLSSRATVEATEVGFFRLSVAGPDRPTGLPEVDAVIADFGRRRPRIA